MLRYPTLFWTLVVLQILAVSPGKSVAGQDPSSSTTSLFDLPSVSFSNPDFTFGLSSFPGGPIPSTTLNLPDPSTSISSSTANTSSSTSDPTQAISTTTSAPVPSDSDTADNDRAQSLAMRVNSLVIASFLVTIYLLL